MQYLRLLTVLCALLLSNFAIANPDSSKATAKVLVTDGQKKPLNNETIFFKGKKSGKLFTGRTNAQGAFSLQLPAGDEYAITIKAMVDTSKYGVLPIAALGEGEFYDQPFVVNIVYEAPRTYSLDAVYFDVNKATLQPSSYKQLNELTEYLKWKSNQQIEIGGHTDNAGNDASNLALSQARAEAVKAYLIKKGIAASRLIAKGYGASQPIADNSTEEGRKQNRRTMVKILDR